MVAPSWLALLAVLRGPKTGKLGLDYGLGQNASKRARLGVQVGNADGDVDARHVRPFPADDGMRLGVRRG